VFRLGTAWSLPLVYAVLLLLTGLGSGISPSLHGLVDLAGLASACLIIPWILRQSLFSQRKYWLLILGILCILILQIALPNPRLPSIPQFFRHILVLLYALSAFSVIWVIFQFSGRGRTGLWWLRTIFFCGIFIVLLFGDTPPDVWAIFAIPCALILLTFRPLKHYPPWTLTLILIASFIISPLLLSKGAWSGEQLLVQTEKIPFTISLAHITINILNAVRMFLAVTSLLLALRIILHGILGIYSPNIRVRTKLILTVLFSSIIPGILLLFLIINGVLVIAGGYCATLVKSMIEERSETLACYLDTLQDPIVPNNFSEHLGGGILEKSSLDIFKSINVGNDSTQLVRISGTLESPFADTVLLPNSCLEQRTCFLVSRGQLQQAAFRAWNGRTAMASHPIDIGLLTDIKKIVGLDIELFGAGSRNDTSSTGMNITIGNRGRSGNRRIIIGGTDTLTTSLSNFISTAGPPSNRWVEKRFYFGMNTLPVIDLDNPGLVNPVYIMTVRTSLASLYQTIFSSANRVNRAIFQAFLVLAALFIITLIIIWGTSIYVARGISSSAAKLMKGTQRLRQGDLEVQIPLSSRDELGEVANSFNLMTRDLKRMMESIAEKERLEQELAIARSIQLNLLPQNIPDIPGVDVFGMSEPAQEVGGDCYDFLVTNNNRLILSIGDVSGKGIAAALLMANLQASLRMLAKDNFSLVNTMRRLNESIYQHTSMGMFVTYFLAVWDGEKNKLTYINAGHDYPMLVRNGEFQSLTTGGMVLGVDPHAEYQEGSIELIPGDWLFLYSDGIVDARNVQGQQFEVPMFQELLRKYFHLSPKEIVTSCMQEINQFSEDQTFEDDRTLVAFRVVS
jgi:serine phosphatase RsbU (regulator of sigma subunit)